MKLRGFAYACFSAALVMAAIGAGALRAPAPLLSQTPPAQAQSASHHTVTTTPGFYRVDKVVDGDTLVAWMNGEDVTVRLIGIDTPETVDPRKPVECWGPEASAEAKKLLTDADVRLVSDPRQDTYDKYGRMLAYVYLPDGTLFNKFMIREGFAHEYTYKKAYQFQKEFKAAQAAAKSAKLGFWSPATCNGNTGVDSATTTVAR